MTAVTIDTQVYEVEWIWIERDTTYAERRRGSASKSKRNRKPDKVVVHDSCEINATDFEDAKVQTEELLNDFINDFLKASPMVERHPNSWNAFVEDPNPKRIWSKVLQPDGFLNKYKVPFCALTFSEKDSMAIHIKLGENQS